jgi:hypothetical protein
MAMVLSLPFVVRGQDQLPLFGTWRLNLAESTFAADPIYSRVTCKIEPWKDGLKVTYDMVGTRGGVTHWEWTGKLDAKDYALQGVEAVVTNAYTRIDDSTYTVVVKEDGRPTTTNRITISPDRKIMTVVGSSSNARGQHVVNTAIYDRQ